MRVKGLQRRSSSGGETRSPASISERTGLLTEQGNNPDLKQTALSFRIEHEFQGSHSCEEKTCQENCCTVVTSYKEQAVTSICRMA